ncbi:ankyrin repeat domain-containing protein [Endozoicomonas sp. ISHI1]|uniref:ankyrin repeat domain-containing protein n=3 Tax=unclassified Endozoicomonas TaxID=2644528 RepID=UPI00214808B0|nr:ankyrin repeat domain-containing protein [Endozoicomonas sp. ISHI1]
MHSFYTFLQLFTVAFVATALTFFTNPEVATGEYLEWQLPIKKQSDSSITIRARSASVATKTQGTRTQSFTGEVTIFGQIDQPFIVCAQSLDAQGFTYEASAVVPFPFSDSDKSTHLYMLTLSERMGRIAIKESQPCPESFNHPYPFTSGQYLRSKKPFLVVDGRVEKTRDTQNYGAIPPVGMSIKPVLFQSPSGGGYDTDDFNDFRRPPFMPVPDKMMVDLILLPTLSLPANWRDYLPFVGVYHWLTNTQPEGVTIVVRFGDSPPFTFRISLAETRELADKLLNTRALLHWLAPRLSGREHLIQQLLELTADSDELLPEEILKSLRKQLAIVLELPDTEFSLEFEYSELERTFKRQTKAQTPPETIQLGNSQNTTSPNPAADKDNKQSDSVRQTHNNEKKQDQPGQNYPEPDNKPTDDTHNALSGDVEYYTIRLLQTEYHVSKRQVLANLDRPASEAGLRLSCLDCQQSGLVLQELLPHAERHWLTCDQCQQFSPTAGTVQARQIMLQSHTRSQCTHYRGQVLGAPLMDNTLTLFRFMIRFGTEETLLDLLQQFDLPIVAEDLNETDRNHRTVLQDLAQYTSPAVIQSFLQRLFVGFSAPPLEPLASSELVPEPSAPPLFDAVAHMECLICMEAMVENVVATSCCGQLFHKDCIIRWVEDKKECSHCRKSISANQLTTIRLPNIVVTKVFDVRPKVKPEEKSSLPDGAKSSHFAIAQSHTETVKARVLLDSDRSERLQDFHRAVSTGNTRLIRELLEIDPSLAKEKDNHGRTTLHKAANQCQTEAIQTLLNFDRSLAKEKDNRGQTALHKAAYNGQTEAIQTLLDFDRSLAKEKDKDGETALHFAVRHGQTEAIQTLLNFDRSLAKEKDRFGNTALHMAAFWGHTEAIQTLLNFDRSLAKETDNYGNTALHEAARNGRTEAIRILLKIEPSLAKEKNNNGNTALDLACHMGHEETAKVLRAAVGNKASLVLTDTVKAEVLSDSDRSRRLRDFHDAASSGNTRLIMELLEIDPSLAKEKDDDGWSALHFAADNGQTEAIQTLLNFEPSLAKEKDDAGRTALYLAARNGHTEAIRTLLDFDRLLAKVKNNDGWSALHIAALRDQTEAIQTLLNFDRSLAKEKDNDGEMALHFAAEQGQTEAIQTLLNFDRSLAKETDKYGDTALDLAIELGHRKCKKLLEDYGAQPSGSLQQ